MSTAAVASYAQHLRHLSWMDIAQRAWLFLLGAIALKVVAPDALKDSLRPLVLIAPLLPFMAKDLAHLPDAVARLRGARVARDWRALATACLPPELLGMLRVNAAMRRGFIAWLRRRPQPALPAGETFSYLDYGGYRTAVAIVLFTTLFELPFDALVLPLFVKDAHTLHLIHCLMAIGSISTLVWVLGDRWLVGPGCHVLTDEGLQLRIGARTGGTIPLDAIAQCRRIDVKPDEWCRRNGVERRQALLASPLDKPNTVLMLTPYSSVRLTHLGVERSSLSCVFLYVDRPGGLHDALRIGLQNNTMSSL